MTRLYKLLLIVLLCALPAAHAQVTETLSGIITDPSGAVIPNATVTLHSDEPLDNISAQTGPTGAYTLAVPATDKRIYRAIVTAAGFATFESKPLALSPQKILTLNIKLKIEDQAQQVDVDASAMDTDPNNNGDSIVLTGKAIDNLPLDSAELLQQLQGMAGGNSPDMYVDGFSGGTLPPRDTIREIRINQNPYSAMNDTNPGNGMIQIFTKPGSGQIHADAYFYGNNSALNTADPFVTNQPAYNSYNIYSFISGPLSKSISFAVDGNYQGSQTNAYINAQYIDPAAPNSQVYIAQAVPTPHTSYNISPRLDIQAGKKSTISIRYGYGDTSQTNGGVGGFSLPSQAYTNDSYNQFIRFSNSQILSARLIMDTRFVYTRSRVNQTPADNSPTISVEGAFTGGGNNGGKYNDNQDRYELQNYFAHSLGKHYLNYGLRFRQNRDANHSLANYNGTYTFSSLTLPSNCLPVSTCFAYQPTLLGQPGGGPSQFSITVGNPNIAVSIEDTALFFQDDWKARPGLTLSGGLRFETQNRIADHADWAPRFGFALNLGAKKSKDGKSSKPGPYMLRGGTGLFYNRFTTGYLLQADRQNGINQQEYIASAPTCYPACGVAQASAQAASTIFQISPTLHVPYNFSNTLSIERQVRTWGSVTLSYLSTRGVHYLLTRNINAPLPGTYNSAIPNSGVRPLGGTQNVYEYDSDGLARGNRLTVNFFFNIKNRYFLYGNYQLRSETSDTTGGFPSNQYNLAADQGRAQTDIRHQGYIGGGFNLPAHFRSGFFVRAQSGNPYNITVGQDLNGDSIFNDRPAFATDLTRQSVVFTRLGAFDTSPTAGQTIIPINYGHGPGFFNVNLNFGREFQFGPEIKPPAGAPAPKLAPGQKPHIDRKYGLGFTIDAQNVFNQVNLAPPISTLNSSLFGRSVALSSSGNNSANRVVDLSAYFHF